MCLLTPKLIWKVTARGQPRLELFSGRSKTYPEANKTSNLPSNFVHADELTTDRRRGDLSDVERGEVRGGADSQPGENATTVDGSKAASFVGGEHDARTEAEDERAEEETVLATEELTNWVAE